MSSFDRLTHLNQLLAGLEEQIAGLEKALSLAPLEDKARLKLLLADKRQEMQPYELERADLLSSEGLHKSPNVAVPGIQILGDLIFGDKIGRDKIGGDKIGSNGQKLDEPTSEVVQFFRSLWEAYQRHQAALVVPHTPAIRYSAELLYRSQQITGLESHSTPTGDHLTLTLNLAIAPETLRQQLIQSLLIAGEATTPLPPGVQVWLDQLQDQNPSQRMAAIEALGDYYCGS